MFIYTLSHTFIFFIGKICGPKKDESSSETTQLTDEDTEPLMGDVAAHIPASVRTLYKYSKSSELEIRGGIENNS